MEWEQRGRRGPWQVRWERPWGAERGPPVAIVRTSSGASQPQGAAMGLQPAGGSGRDGGGSSLGRAGRSAGVLELPLGAW